MCKSLGIDVYCSSTTPPYINNCMNASVFSVEQTPSKTCPDHRSLNTVSVLYHSFTVNFQDIIKKLRKSSQLVSQKQSHLVNLWFRTVCRTVIDSICIYNLYFIDINYYVTSNPAVFTAMQIK